MIHFFKPAAAESIAGTSFGCRRRQVELDIIPLATLELNLCRSIPHVFDRVRRVHMTRSWDSVLLVSDLLKHLRPSKFS